MRELLQRIDSRELAEWQAYYRIEPFGEERADLRNAMLMCEVIRPYLKPGYRVTPADFMPFADAPPPMTGDQLLAKAQAIFGG